MKILKEFKGSPDLPETDLKIIYVIIKCCIFMVKIKCLKQTFIDDLFQIQVLINGRRGLQNMEFWQIGLLGPTWQIEDQDLARKKLARVNNISSM